MKSCAFVLSVALAASLAGDARAQCQRGGGTSATPTMSAGTGTVVTSAVPLVSSAEAAYQLMQRAYAQEMQRAYMQQMQRSYQQQQEAAAQEREDRRQQRIAVWREHRQAELARREAAKERNLARRNSDRSLAVK
jgi:hypothetical protein